MTTPLVTTAVLDDWQVWMPENVEKYRNSSQMPLSQFVSSLEKAAQDAGKPHLAWLVGSSCNYLSRGILGKVAMNAKTLGMGLHWLCRFYPLIQDATLMKLDINDDTARLVYKVLDPNIWPREQDALYTLSIFANFLKLASVDLFSQAKICIEAPKTQSNSELHRHLHAPVIYSSSVNEIVFPAKYLAKSLNNESNTTQSEIAELSKRYSQKNRKMLFIDRAKYVIYNALLETDVNQRFVANELCLSTRTLRRKLMAEGKSYQSLLDDCRMDLASRELTLAKHVSLAQMALKLGYSEHSTFSRAFLRWFGVSPRTYRKMMTGTVSAN
ncbi:MAG: AraC family transcriptional regulator ligand-binding domain-containing protein [Paraglaciecola sp.]|nr:AraC family transcriptional regulator ligand-binding domain-containing protein [Paraglaciecola sp.]